MINKILSNLEKEYASINRTTLNSMRKNATPFQILIACILSLQVKDEATKKATENLFKIAKTPKQILNLPTKKLEELIYSSRHYKKKAQTIKHISKEIINRFKNRVPNTKEELLSIKGIGPKTANIVLNFAFNKPVIPVDSNVHRISNRIGLVNTKNPKETENQLNKITTNKQKKEINALLMLHGKNYCLTRKPNCKKCPIEKYCKKTKITEKPDFLLHKYHKQTKQKKPQSRLTDRVNCQYRSKVLSS